MDLQLYKRCLKCMNGNVIEILGCIGAGKTTLLREISSERVNGQINYSIIVIESDNFLDEILSSLLNEHYSSAGDQISNDVTIEAIFILSRFNFIQTFTNLNCEIFLNQSFEIKQIAHLVNRESLLTKFLEDPLLPTIWIRFYKLLIIMDNPKLFEESILNKIMKDIYLQYSHISRHKTANIMICDGGLIEVLFYCVERMSFYSNLGKPQDTLSISKMFLIALTLFISQNYDFSQTSIALKDIIFSSIFSTSTRCNKIYSAILTGDELTEEEINSRIINRNRNFEVTNNQVSPSLQSINSNLSLLYNETVQTAFDVKFAIQSVIRSKIPLPIDYDVQLILIDLIDNLLTSNNFSSVYHPDQLFSDYRANLESILWGTQVNNEIYNNFAPRISQEEAENSVKIILLNGLDVSEDHFSKFLNVLYNFYQETNVHTNFEGIKGNLFHPKYLKTLDLAIHNKAINVEDIKNNPHYETIASIRMLKDPKLYTQLYPKSSPI